MKLPTKDNNRTKGRPPKVVLTLKLKKRSYFYTLLKICLLKKSLKSFTSGSLKFSESSTEFAAGPSTNRKNFQLERKVN